MNWKKWKRRLLIAFLALVSLMLLLVAGVYLAVHSPAVHRRVLALMIGEAQKSTGGRVELRDFTFHWSGLDLDLDHPVLHGTEPAGAQPLFAADHIGVNLSVISWLGRAVRLRSVTIDNPSINVLIDGQGHSNVPEPSGSQSVSHTDIFDLSIRRFALRQGSIRFNDQQVPLAATLENVNAQVRYLRSGPQYACSISYNRGQVRYGTWNPAEHSVDTQFEATRTGLETNHLVLTAGSSQISVQGSLVNYTHPQVHAAYQASLLLADLRRIMKIADMPTGNVTTHGTLRFSGTGGKSFLHDLVLDGQASSPDLGLDLPQLKMQARLERSRYHLAGGKAQIRDVAAALLGGQATAELTIENLAGKRPTFHLAGAVRQISLTELNRVVRAGASETVPLTGAVDGKADATWTGLLNDLQVKSDLAVTAAASAASGAIPVQGAIHLAFDGAHNVLTLYQSDLETPQSHIRLNGALALHSELDIQAHCDDLRELDNLLLPVRRAGPRSQAAGAPQLFGLRGSATFTGSLEGSPTSPQISGQLAATNLEVENTSWTSLRARVRAGPSAVSVEQATLEVPASSGRITFNLNAGLHNWSYDASSPVSLDASPVNVPLAPLLAIANVQYPIRGTLDGRLSFHGTPLHPTGQGSLRIGSAWIKDEPLQSVNLQLEGTGDSIHSTINLRAAAGAGTAHLTYNPASQAYDLQFAANPIHLEGLKTLSQLRIPVEGLVNITAEGRGTLDQPQLQADIDSPKITYNLADGAQPVETIHARLNIANRRATFSADANFGGTLEARGTVDLTGDYNSNFSLSTGKLALTPLLARYLPLVSADMQGQAEVHASLTGPLKKPSSLVARVEIPSLSVAYQKITLANHGPLKIDFAQGLLTLQPSDFQGSGTDLRLEGRVPILPSMGAAPMQVTATGTVDLKVLRLVNPTLDSTGQVTLNFSAKGSRTRPDFQGQVSVANGSMYPSAFPLGISSLDGQLQVAGNRLQVRQLTAQVGGGNVAVTGFITYQPNLTYALALNADNVRLRYPVGVRTILESNLQLSGTPKASRLTGRVLIDRLALTHEFDLLTLADRLSAPTVPSSRASFQNSMRLDVGVQSTEELSLASSKLNMQGSANLRVSGTVADPVIVGRALVNAGEVTFRGQTYQVQQGVFDFINPYRTEPTINLTLSTTVSQYEVTMNLVGPVDRLRVHYSSVPALPPVDIINLLAVGKTATEQAGTAGSVSAAMGAESVLAQSLSSAVSSRIERLVGISNLQIDPLLGGSNSEPGARLAIQQRVTRNLSFTYATDVRTTQREVIQVEYQFTRRWSLSVTRDEFGTYGLDVRGHKTF